MGDNIAKGGRRAGDFWTLAPLSALLIAAALFTFWTTRRADRETREETLAKVRLIARAINADSVKALTGAEGDIDKPEYQRLKTYFSLFQETDAQCRAIYLLGKKADGAIFFLVSSDAVNVTDYAAPGQVLKKTSRAFRDVFDNRATIAGPYGNVGDKRVVSALVPIYDSRPAMTGHVTSNDARAMARKALAFYRKNGRERLLKAINAPGGEFRRGDLYVFVYGLDMTMLAHPATNGLTCPHPLAHRDGDEGKRFRENIRRLALSQGSGWVGYDSENPFDKRREAKATYFEKVDDLIVCSNAYKGAGAVIAALGVDMDARGWRRKIIQAAFPPAALTLTLAVILTISAIFLTRRARNAAATGRTLQFELAQTIAVGLALTLFAAWLANANESDNRVKAFKALAAGKTEAIAETFHALRSIELESLARFYESSDNVTLEEFQHFSALLTKNPAVQAWEYIPAVSATTKSDFEKKARAMGFKDFEIWQQSARGKREPATGRDTYYPVFWLAPLMGNEAALGYDLGSEPLRRAALLEAARLGLSTATAPITLVQEFGDQKGLLIYRPLRRDGAIKRQNGFILAVLRTQTALESALPDDMVPMTLSLALGKGQSEQLASTADDALANASASTLKRPIFAFGKVFIVTAREGPEFARLYPARAGGIAALAGLSLTAALAIMIGMAIRRREALERLVREQTAELRESEEYLSATLRSIGDGVIGVNADGQVTSLNIIAEQLTGWSAAEAAGHPVEEVFRTVRTQTVTAVDEQALLVARNGTEYRVESTRSPIRTADGATLGAALVFRDISARLRAEKERARQTALINSLLDSIPDIIFYKDIHGVYLGCNPPFAEFVGRPRNEIIGKTDYQLFDKDVADRFREHDRVMLMSRQPRRNEEWITYPDGRKKLIDTLKTPYWGPDGALIGILGVSRDITARKRAEEALRESETNFRVFFETLGDMVIVADPNGKIQYANKALERKLGYTAEELTRTRTPTLYPEGKRREIEDIFAAMPPGERDRRVLPMIAKNGAPVPVETCVWSGKWNGADCVFGLSKDLTAEQEAQQRFERLFRNNPALMALTSLPERQFFDVNDAFLKTLGYSRSEVIGKTATELNLFSCPKQQTELVDRLLKGKRVDDFEALLRRKDGEIIDALISSERIGSQGKQYFLTVMIDITARKRAEEALKESERHFRNFFENAPIGIFHTFIEGRLRAVNPALAKMLGYASPEEMIEQVSDLATQIYMDPRARHELVATLKKHDGWVHYRELVWRRKDGRPITVDINGRKVLDHAGNIVYLEGFIVDITERERAKAALQESETRLNLAINGAEAGLWDWDMVNDRVYFSPRWKTMLGYEDQDIENAFSGWKKLWHPDDAKKIEKAINDYLEGKTTRYEIEHRLRHKSGDWLWILTRGETLKDRNGKPYRWVGTNIDITHIKRIEALLREKSEELDGYFSSSLDLLCIANTSGRFVRLNPEWEKALGYSLAELEGRPFLDFVHPDDIDATRAVVARLKDQEQILSFENRYRRKDGAYRWIEWRSRPRGELIYAAARDITKRKRAEEELRQANVELEKQTNLAREMATQAQAANAAKSEFLANMSHEIRTPMNGVIGMIGLLLNTELNSAQQRYAELARASGEALLALINDILDFSKIEAKKLELETMDFDLEELLEDIAAGLAIRAQEKGLELICDLDPAVPAKLRGDPGRLRQILTNLIGNAIKFTHQGEVVLRVATVSQTDHDVLPRFSISDTGIGIPKNKLGILFDKFIQADTSTTRSYGGTGLGLAISRQLAEMMGGEIGVNSEEGKGSEFWFTARLGLGVGETMEENQPPAIPPGTRILIVDDNAAYRKILMARLTSWGLRPEAVPDGFAALERLYRELDAEAPFPLAAIDTKMPCMDGATLALTIKSDQRLSDTRLIAMIAAGEQDASQRFEDIGFSAWLSKPVRRRAMKNALELALADRDVTRTPSSEPGRAPQKAKVPFAESDARILLVEDNFTNQLVALGLLKNLGLRADTVANGAEAIKALENAPYDLVLMDAQMPVMDGLESTRRIRDPKSAVLNRDIPIVAMTAHAMRGDREKCLEAGMNDYLSKPITPRELVEKLRKWLPKNKIGSETNKDIPEAERVTADAPSPVEAPDWDKAKAMRYLMSNESLVQTVMKSFLLDLPTRLDDLKTALAAGDRPRVERQTHTIKSAAANVGGDALSEIAAEMEKAARNGDLSAVAARVNEINARFNRLREAIEKGL